ncbi:HNH endonuclease [Prosthecobacter sp.]|uniref:HNH endonuclease n=1 Tax=Prosthecobacter sp. TaxID=1965333 RepID=UPI003783F310
MGAIAQQRPLRRKWLFPSLKIDGREISAEVARQRHCDHLRKGPHVALQSDGKPFYRIQCPDCGEKLSLQLPHSSVPNRERCPQWNEELYQKRLNGGYGAYDQIRAAAVARRKAEWRAVYHRYLASADWQSVRQRVLKRARGICEGCLEAAATQVHHQTYAHVGDELLFELVAICRPCHERLHPKSSTGDSELLERHLQKVDVYGC